LPEAVAIGKAIEEREKPKAAERKRLVRKPVELVAEERKRVSLN